ncbi:MAG: YdcF family protein [Gammaproteobacteria bacterium]
MAALFVYPLTLALAAIMVSAIALGLDRRRWAGYALGVALVGLWLCSTPAITDALRASLETRYPPLTMAQLPSADAIVVLGGGVEGAAPPYRLYPDLGGSADRVWFAARLFKAGKAPLIIASGGRLPWTGAAQAEAPAIVELLEELGVPSAALAVESESLNTYQNAVNVKPILQQRGLRSILLVTSAMHMTRALGTFRAQGIEVYPAPTDYEFVPAPASLLRWLPDAAALAGTTQVLKEYFGTLVYRWRGWSDAL